MRYALPNAASWCTSPRAASPGRRATSSAMPKHHQNETAPQRAQFEDTKRTTSHRETLDRDYFMTADQAKDSGLIDKVIKSRDEPEAMLSSPGRFRA